ncbi:DUF2146 domain containing protein [Trichuris trichiura]|uniref:Nonsense-mediated mRNA decay factor SMG8 n=1 Tax=Trichuris trichiura TaxID=36087 RepID=A0A077Z2T0_TRITR|nr:DUF2146 domain containing protein [Trichuris trichiura]
MSYEARGSLVEEALAKLKSSCEEVWRGGRQQCEAVSMCGNPCSLQVILPGEEEDNSLPVLAHDSKVAFLSTCNGGHSQSIRHDPFDLRSANYSFFEENPDFACCRFCNRGQDYSSSIISLNFYVVRIAQESDQPNVSTPIESVISAICRSSSSEGSESENEDDINGKPLGDVAGEKLDNSAFLGINLGTFDNEQLEGNEEEVKTYVGVPNSTIQCGMQPEFPSYAIVCVGSSSKYTHSRGLRDQPNFSHGSQYLLPWDVDVSVDGDKWQEWQIKTGTLYSRGVPLKKSFHKKRGSSLWDTNMNACVAIVSCFGRLNLLQEKAENIVQEDMPLWFPCSCRGTKPFLLGLLTRIHVVTPKAPVHVCVNPRIQPDTTQDLVFMIGLHKLGPSKYWIVRLPFIYHNPGGPTFWRGEGDAPEGLVFKHMLQVDPDFPPQSKDESMSS